MRLDRIIAFLALALAIGLAFSWMVGSMLVAATPSSSVSPLIPSPERHVRLAADPGIMLDASYWPQPDPSAPAVLLLHGNGGNRGMMVGTARWLHARGYAALAIDLRGHGASTPTDKSFGYHEATDAHAALTWLRARHPQARIGVIGYSLGGAAALLGPRGPVDADALVLMSVHPDIRTAVRRRIAAHAGSFAAAVLEPLLSYQSWPRLGRSPDALAPVGALRQVRAPVLLVGSDADRYTTATDIARLQRAAPPGTRRLILSGLSHNDVVGYDDPAWRAQLLAFLDRHLRR